MITITMTPTLRAICAHANTLEIDAPSDEEFNELKADLFAAHAHIQHLHYMILGSDNPSPLGLLCAVINWEDDQCPF